MNHEKERKFYGKLRNIEFDIHKKWFEIREIGTRKSISQMFTTHNSLFHYTTISGLIGIIENNCFWLTNLNYMNDLSERNFACQVVKKAITDLKESEEYPQDFREILKHVYINNEKEIDYYAACFTNDGDSLPMWCMYGKECGVSIEIDLKKDFTFAVGPNCFFEDMIYEEEILYDFVKETVDLYYQAYMDAQSEKDINMNIVKHDIAIELSKGVLCYIDNFKHERFSHESETRLLYRYNSGIEIKHRIKNNLIASYIEYPPKKLNENKLLPIISIMVGPGEEQELVKKSVRDFMKSKGYDVEVKLSSIPYRAR